VLAVGSAMKQKSSSLPIMSGNSEDGGFVSVRDAAAVNDRYNILYSA